MYKNIYKQEIVKVIDKEINKIFYKSTLGLTIIIGIIVSLIMLNVFNEFYSTKKEDIIIHNLLFFSYSYFLVLFFNYFKNTEFKKIEDNLEDNLNKFNLNKQDFYEIINNIGKNKKTAYIENYLDLYIEKKQNKINTLIKEGK